jgi:HSP20 family protein
MAEQNPQTGNTSPQQTTGAQAERARQAQAEAGRQAEQVQAEQGSAASTPQGGRSVQPGQGESRETQRGEESWPTAWSMAPFSVLGRMFEEMDRFFDELGFGRSRLRPQQAMLREGGGGRGMRALWAPQIEISEREGQLVICADLPGLRKEDVKVDLTDDVLTIEGERQEQREGRGYSERTYGSFHRTIPLPEGVSAEGAQANFRDGVLEVRIPMPKREQPQKQRRLEIG